MGALDGRRVAVIGSGITGLSAAWVLHRNGAKVTLFEKEPVCGGHTLTDHTSPYPIDLGFQVYNLTTYPHLVGFLEALGVDTEPSDMSFALSMDNGKLEWGSDNLDTIFAQRKNLASPGFLRMVADVVRFGRCAPRVLEPATHHVYREMTLGQYLQAEGYSAYFRDHYVIPMCAAVWSVPSAQVLQFPVQMLIRFWVNHHLLDLFQRPLWRVVKGRAQEYVKRVCAELPDVRAGTGVASVQRAEPGAAGPAVTVVTEAGEEVEFDAVLFATHADITLRLLGGGADAQERDILGAVPYADNDIYLHTDTDLMPRSRKVWSSWNFLGNTGDDTSAVCVSYWANRLQHLPAGAPDMFVTLNPPQPPAADKTIRRLNLAHPVFSFKSWEAQARLPELQGHRACFYAGAWAGYGFHEDGIKSAVEAVGAMGAAIPWVPRSCSPKVSLAQRWFVGLFDAAARAAIRRGHLRVILPTGYELSYGDPATPAHAPEGPNQWRGCPPLRATLRVFSMDLFRKLVLRHDTGLGESYMDGDYEVDDLGALLAVMCANAADVEESRGKMGALNWLGDRLLYLAHKARANTIEGSRKNIEEHYDAGNAMYKLFLDDSMMYSSAMHAPGDKDLYEAQMRKLDAIIDAAGIQAGDEVLEIGCGWGAFAIRAVQRTGCRVTGLTLSKEQLAEATARVKAAGLQDAITLLFCDYRDCEGVARFDRVVSIEMIEAVGHENLPTYFGAIGRLLKPGGRAVLQAISCPDDRYAAYCASSDFIREHIFPGGHLPCIGAMVEAARGTGLALRDTADIGPDYAVTLREWRARWEARKADLLALGYSERFWRKYRFYFAYCEAGFDARYIHNFHLTWVKGGEEAGGAQAAAGSSQGARPASTRLAAQLSNELPSDPVTQALLALYFFLAGMLVVSHPVMWVLPVVSCACVAASAGVHAACAALLPSYLSLTPDRQAWWCADVVHLLYSACAAVSGLALALSDSRTLALHNQPAPGSAVAGRAQLLVAASAGFFAAHLWQCVRYRLFTRSRAAIMQYTVALLLCGVAVYRSANLPFLGACMATEVGSVVLLAARLANMAGWPKAGSTGARALATAERGALVGLRLVPHAAITLVVVAQPGAWPSLALWCGALGGLGALNAANVKRAAGLGLFKGAAASDKPAAKLHAQ